ncbi:hypothetical protein [Brevibacillus laterosporus]|uniref:hypothetical protein n=1 Tax=Brevibacillus laterosporus TaxID=1465 RepID=UPI003D1C4FA0
MSLSNKTDILNQKYKLRLFQALSTYYCVRGKNDLGFHYNIEALQLALYFKNVERLKRIILMHYQFTPSEKHKEMFINIMAKGDIQNKKTLISSLMILSLLGFIGMSFEAPISTTITEQSVSTNGYGEGW